MDFTVAENKVHFGLSAIKGCGGSAAEAIAVEKEQAGPFTDLFDFCERVDPQSCNRAAIETLIKAGAFDSLGARRSQLLAVLDRAVQAGASAAADRRSGQKNLFQSFDDSSSEETTDLSLPDIPEVPERELLALEKEVLGFYLSSHPLSEYQNLLETY